MVPDPAAISDTSPAAEQLQFEIWRRMSPAEKFAAFLDLQATAEAFAEAGIRRRYPLAVHLDRDTMVRCYDWDPELHQ